jgi:hypothetical protein
MSYFSPGGKGQIVCPVPGAVAVDAPPQKKRAASWFPPETLGGNAAVGAFFTQNCPGYLSASARQYIHTISQLNARELWQPYSDIEAGLRNAAKANQTSVATELSEWCMDAEPRIAAIQNKLGQALK